MEATTAMFQSGDLLETNLDLASRADPSTLRAIVAGILDEQGRKIYYVGTPRALGELADDEGAAALIPPEQRWTMRPIGRIARTARVGMEELLKDGSADPAVLGVLCLPEAVSDALLRPAAAGYCAVVLEGMDANDPDVAFALRGVRALANRTQALLATFP